MELEGSVDMHYPIVIHKDPGSSYGVTVPDLPGCFSGAETLEGAISNARAAIAFHIEGLLLQGEPTPEPSPCPYTKRTLTTQTESGSYRC